MRVPEVRFAHEGHQAAVGAVARQLEIDRGGFTRLFHEVHAEVARCVQEGFPGRLSADERVAAFPAALPGSAELASQRGRVAGWGSDAQQAQRAATLGQADAAEGFVQALGPLAAEAGQQLGVARHIVLAHAALESGWGQRPLRDSSGGDSHNVFGIKAAGGWKGGSVTAMTTEVEQGVARARSERFRSYPDHAQAFRDFTNLLLTSARYREALNVGDDVDAYAHALSRGGYATDPAYATKLKRTAERVAAQEVVNAAAPASMATVAPRR